MQEFKFEDAQDGPNEPAALLKLRKTRKSYGKTEALLSLDRRSKWIGNVTVKAVISGEPAS